MLRVSLSIPGIELKMTSREVRVVNPTLTSILLPHREMGMFSQTRSRPVRHILVGDPRGDVDHKDSALAFDIISVAKYAEFFLAVDIPDVKADGGCARAP
jgi:hypothetical protein